MLIRVKNVTVLAIIIGCAVLSLSLTVPSHGAWLGQNCGKDPASVIPLGEDGSAIGGNGEPSTTPPNVWRYLNCADWFMYQHCISGGATPPRGWFGRLGGCPGEQLSCWKSTCCPDNASACYLFWYGSNGELLLWTLGCKAAGNPDCE